MPAAQDAPPPPPPLGEIERALRASQERLRKLVASANDAVIVMDAQGLIVEWNPRADWMFGWTAGEAIGQRLSALIVPLRYRERHEAGLRRFLNTRQSRVIGRSVELHALRRDGVELPIELSLWPLEDGADILFGAFVRDISARHAAQEALRRQEEKYRVVVDNCSEGILVVRDGRIVFANPAIERLVGLGLGELQARPFTERIHPDDQPRVAERYARRLRGEEVEQHYAFRVFRADGSLLWLELSAVPIDWDGQPATLSFITDITERKRLQDTLQQSLLERETILDNSIVGILFLGPDRLVRWVNSALVAMFRTDREAVIGRPTVAFYPDAETYRRTGEAVADAVGAGRSFEVEMPMRRADGEVFWAYVSGRAINRGDLLQGTVWALLDISRRRALEVALQRKTEEQEAILQSPLIGICLVVAQRFQWLNRTLADLLGYPLDALMGAHAGVLFAGAGQWEAFIADVQEALRTRGAYEGTHRMLRRDGGEIWIQLQGTRLADGDAGRGSLWTFLDVTQRQRAEEEIRRTLEREQELSAMKSRFVSMTSHEFRTPLAGILSSIELLRHYSDRLPADEKQELYEQVERSVERMTRMLDNILLIGRAESRGLRFDPQPGDLAAFLREVADEARALRLPSARQPTVELDLDPLPALCAFDRALLHHVFGNLLSNAIKYSPQGGTVRLRCRRDAAGLQVEVSDEGIGIPEADLKRLFETFHRASNVGNIAGTGLGLAIVKQAAELHGGRIEVSSRAGEGSCFRVHLPLAMEDTAA